MSLQEKAFPNPHLTGDTGMTLRDYFAAKAMQAILSTMAQGIRPNDVPLMASDCYMVADAMMEARK
jgi:hypothetical protein